MITNFEEITKELNQHEHDVIVPILIKVLRQRVGKDRAITNRTIVSELKKMNIKTSSPRIRKMIHFIRITGTVTRLIATSKGYFVPRTKAQLEKYIESLHQRVNSINEIIKQLEFQNKP